MIHVVSAADGELLWSHEFSPGMNHTKEARAMFVGDRLWILHGGKHGTDSNCSALDRRTGQVMVTHEAGLCHCFPPVATQRYLFGGEMDTGYYARKLFEALDDQQIERLVGKFLSPDVHRELVGSGDFSFDWQRRIILKAVRHHNMRPVFRSFGPILTPLLLRLGVARLV